jgi:hypothetical protein
MKVAYNWIRVREVVHSRLKRLAGELDRSHCLNRSRIERGLEPLTVTSFSDAISHLINLYETIKGGAREESKEKPSCGTGRKGKKKVG